MTGHVATTPAQVRAATRQRRHRLQVADRGLARVDVLLPTALLVELADRPQTRAEIMRLAIRDWLSRQPLRPAATGPHAMRGGLALAQ